MTRHGEVFFLSIVLNILLGLESIQGESIKICRTFGVMLSIRPIAYLFVYLYEPGNVCDCHWSMKIRI